MSAAIKPERILKDLAKLWVDLAKEDGEKNSAGVLRACAMTLVVAVEEQEDAQAVGQTIAELMHEHPSRAIVLHVKNESGGELNARVFAQCWMPFGRRQQICCEEIEITAPEPLLPDVPKLLLGLTVPDLPVVLWIRCPQMALRAKFQRIFPLANKIIIDSDTFNDPVRGFGFVADMNRRGINVVDLAWTRLTPWREMVWHIFEDERNRPYLERITKVTIVHSGASIQVKYLTGWFEHALPEAEVVFETASNGLSRIREIRFDAPGFTASIEIQNGTSAVLKVNDLTQTMAVPESTERALIGQELSIVGVDPVFRRSLE